MTKRKNETLYWLDIDVTQSPWSVIRCPYCGYRMKLCSMCDVRDGGKCDWNSKTGEARMTKTAEQPQPPKGE